MSRFRKQYRPLAEWEKDLVEQIKTAAEALDQLIGPEPTGREMALARTKLEECVMWATKAVTG